MQTKMLVKNPESVSSRTNNPVNNKPAVNKPNVRTTDYKKLLHIMLNDPDAITREEFLFLQSVIGYRRAVTIREEAKLRKKQRKLEQTKVTMNQISLEKSNSESKKDSDDKKEALELKNNDEKNPLQMKKDDGNSAASSAGMPSNLRAGLEKLSGVDLSDVNVHQNSDKPQQVGALAYTQGNSIHVAPGQEKHLPHEGWHAVQQKQGRVKPTMQMKTGAFVNDNAGLEKEADLMGSKAEGTGSKGNAAQLKKTSHMQQESKVIQRITQEEAMRLSKQNTHDANEGNTWNIKAGEYNRNVFEAQDMLRDIGYNLSKRGVDGKWSPGGETYKALLKFQKTCKDTYNGLKQNAPAQILAQVNYMQGVEPTGKLDKATYNALKKEVKNKVNAENGAKGSKIASTEKNNPINVDIRISSEAEFVKVSKSWREKHGGNYTTWDEAKAVFTVYEAGFRESDFASYSDYEKAVFKAYEKIVNEKFNMKPEEFLSIMLGIYMKNNIKLNGNYTNLKNGKVIYTKNRKLKTVILKNKKIDLSRVKVNPKDDVMKRGYNDESLSFQRDYIKKNGDVYRSKDDVLTLIDNGDGTYTIQNGHHRVKAAQQMGIKELKFDEIITTK